MSDTPMKDYTVCWEIDVMASSPEQAALKALLTQRDTESWATVFDVNTPTNTFRVDLSDDVTRRRALKDGCPECEVWEDGCRYCNGKVEDI